MIKPLLLVATLAAITTYPAQANDARPVDIAFCERYQTDLGMMFDDYAAGATCSDIKEKYLEPAHDLAYMMLRRMPLSGAGMSIEETRFVFVTMMTSECIKSAAEAMQ